MFYVKKFITLIFVLLLLLTSCSDAGKRGEPDFGNSRWGDSMETVYKNEKGGLWRLLAPECELAGLSATPYLNFNEQDLLCGGSYTGLASSDIDNFTAYNTARDYLVSSYGEPLKETFFDATGKTLATLREVEKTGGWAEAEWQPATTNGERRTDIFLRWVHDGNVQVDFQAKESVRGQEATPDFLNSYWGDKREQVYANENGGLWQLQVTTEFAGHEVPAYFVFQGEKNLLQLAYYDLTEADLGKRTKFEKYKLAWEQMEELYGEPLHEIYTAPDGAQLSSPDGAEDVTAAWAIYTPEDGLREDGLRTVVHLSLGRAGLGVSFACATPHLVYQDDNNAP